MTNDFATTRESSAAPQLTLIVATLGRTAEVAALLHSIPPTARPLIEVVVVDGNAKPLTNVLAPFQQTLALVHVRTFLRNASAARNLGAAISKAAWLMFPDDDARFASGTLESLLGTISTDTLDLVSGSIVDDAGTPHLLPWPTAPTHITSKTLDCTLVESSFAIRKTVFDAVGGFDPNFGPGGCFHSAEGADLVRRLWQIRAVRALYTPAIRLHHPSKEDDLSPAGFVRTFRFAIGEGAFTARHHRQLRRLSIGRKLLFRAAGVFICGGVRRQRKVAFLKGFCEGVLSYRRFNTPKLAHAFPLPSKKMNPVLSLVIATLDRVAQLERCLASLPQHCDVIEVVVVDQSATRSAWDVVQRFHSKLQISYKYQKVPAASSARNLGVAYARGEWVGFPDDDARFCDDTIAALLGEIESSRWDVVSGMTCDEAGAPTVVSWRKQATRITRRSLRDTVAESTLFLRRSVFLDCGGFDPIFGPGGSFGAEEAIDMLRRMQLRHPGLRMQYFPQIRLIHADSSPYGDADALRKAHRYAQARGACFARHWKQASKRRITSEVCRHVIGSVVFRGLRRQSRIDCLRGYVAGFREYRQTHVTGPPHPQPNFKAIAPEQICEP